MNRNLQQLCALLLVAAALVGCGGGNPAGQGQTPGLDAQVPDVNQPLPDSNPVEAANDSPSSDIVCPDKLGGACSSPGTHSTCANLICDCESRNWVTDENVVTALCLKDGGLPDTGQETDAGSEAGEDADAQVEADATDGGADQDADSDAPKPPPEICDNGIDDDFNGLKDCADPACAAFPKCQPEVCNNMDDNGDGLKDNGPGMECVGFAGNTQDCAFSCNGNTLPGHKTCDTGTCKWSGCAKNALVETNCANGVDDDCDSKTDCQDPDCANFVACRPEICNNGVDDNANGKADCDDPACASASNCVCNPPSIGGYCPVAGAFSCTPQRRCGCDFMWHLSSDPVFSCQTQEVCNGQDDNGNSQIDEGFACVQHSTVACMTSCNSTGSQYCKDDCTPAACQPPPENCNNSSDDDCDSKADCQDPDCENAPNCQTPEVCNGVDDDHDGLIDNGPGMECVGTPGNTRSCTTSCGSIGHQPCSLTTCQWDACQKPASETQCNDGKDDDCDGWTDCQDPDCWGTLACPHNFGTCQPLTPTGVPHTCGTWTKEIMNITGVDRIFACCTNSANDEWCLGGNYTDLKLIHNTSAWAEVALPVAGAVGAADVLCLGSNQVYVMYNEKNAANGVLLRWNGNNLVRLAQTQTANVVLTTMYGFTSMDIRLVGLNAQDYADARFYKWNGSALAASPLPTFPPRRILASALWGMSSQDIYLAGALRDPNNTNDDRGLFLHFDGTSWARIQTPTDSGGFGSVHGSSSCDVMVAGYQHSSPYVQGITLQRNGTTWDQRTFPDINGITSVTKLGPFKYLLMGAKPLNPGTWGWIGTPNGDFTVTWTPADPDPQKFAGGTVSWHVPGTSIMKIAGEGGGAWILHSTCQ